MQYAVEAHHKSNVLLTPMATHLPNMNEIHQAVFELFIILQHENMNLKSLLVTSQARNLW